MLFSPIANIEVSAPSGGPDKKFEEFFYKNANNNDNKWSLKVRKRPGETVSVAETKNKIEAFLRQLRKNMPDSELVLCVFYTSYVNYIENQIFVKWSNEFSGWCDLYTVMSEKLHQRNLVIKAPLRKIRGLRSTKCSSKTLQNLQYFMYKKTHVVFSFFNSCSFIFLPYE